MPATTTKSEPLPWASSRTPLPFWIQSRPEPPMASDVRLLGDEPWPLSRLERSDPGMSPLDQEKSPLTAVVVCASPATLVSSWAALMVGRAGVLPRALLATTPTTADAATTAATSR